MASPTPPATDPLVLGRLRESERRLQVFLRNSPLAYLEIDSDLRVRDWNAAAEEVFGYARAEALGRTVEELILPPLEETAAARATLSGQTAGHRSSTVNVTKHGTRIVCEWIQTPLKDANGQVTGLAILARDVTERKRAEEALRQAKEAAEAANRAKGEFLSRISHELRTPLNAILGFAQILEQEQLPAAHRDAVAHILQGGRHLLALINEVLDITQLEQGKLPLRLEPVAAAALVREGVAGLRPLAESRQVRVGADLDAVAERWVVADRERLRQVVDKVLTNAIQYNHLGGAVTILGQVASGGTLRLAVRDTGPGIPSEQLARLFQPFERLGAERTGVPGSGLGLALSQRLLEAMGGRLSVTSAPGTGTTLTLELPLTEPPAASPGAPARRLVLYVEDNPANQRLVQHVLAQRPGVEVLTALTGREGVELARQHKPHLILLDVHLPDLPGEEVLGLLRTDPAARPVPVVVVSADATGQRQERVRQAGADAYLTKPFNVANFLEVVDRYLGALPAR